MGDFKKGDWVFFEPWGREPELGRFVSYADNGGLFVCYGTGCTASNTASTMVRKANDDELPDPLPKIGYHRFDDYCPDYTESACSGLCPHLGDIAKCK